MELAAFPGAVGHGSRTPGGRGGRILFVTNTNDSGPGSLREALEYPAPRFIVFLTGGLLDARSPLYVRSPFCTIAGQSAPSPFAIKGAQLWIQTHDVLVRGLRARTGKDPGYNLGNRDGIALSGFDEREVYNVVIDHCSFAWAPDENISVWDNSTARNKVHDITFSYVITCEGLDHVYADKPNDRNSYGFLVGDDTGPVTIHHCLFVSNGGRNPLVKERAKCELVNNVIGFWRYEGIKTLPGAMVDIRGNMTRDNTDAVSPIWIIGSQAHLEGNIGAIKNENGVLSDSPLVSSGIADASAEQALQDVLRNAGAWPRDFVDWRQVYTFESGLQPIPGKWLPDDPREVGGWPQYEAGILRADSNANGLPDAFEESHGGNLDPCGLAPSGYTWIEEWVNSLLPQTRPAFLKVDIRLG